MLRCGLSGEGNWGNTGSDIMHYVGVIDLCQEKNTMNYKASFI
jgi:hypothetical protein